MLKKGASPLACDTLDYPLLNAIPHFLEATMKSEDLSNEKDEQCTEICMSVMVAFSI